MPGRIAGFIFLGLVLGASLAAAEVGNGPLNGQRFWGEITVEASPQTVWQALTDKDAFAQIFGFEYEGEKRTLMEVGDHFPGTYTGDKGMTILVYAKPYSEVRHAWEPENGSYICQSRWRLVPDGAATRVLFEERYTLSGIMSPGMLAQEVAHYTETMDRLKAHCEKNKGGE